MKISKLFHWLYALLMLMPVFFIGFTCCYVVFNDNAFESYYGETINESENVAVNINNLEQNNTYYIQTSYLPADVSGLSNVTFNITYAKNLNNGLEYLNDTYNRLRFFQNNQSIYIQFMRIDGGTSITYTDPAIIEFTYVSNNSFGTIRDYLSVYQIEYNRYSYLDDVFEYSLDKLEDSPYFSWAYDSFLVSPFRYIGNLFSVPSNSVIYLFLSYWLDISIIYLVFDMVMYVPLLVHRWLDKGVLE